jgi:hypothetical protein
MFVVPFADPEGRTVANGWVRRLAKITGNVILGLFALLAIALNFTVGWRHL